MLDQVEIFTDGACKGNPGPGGWAAILRYNQHEKEISGGELLTTNNRMELTAAIKALQHLNRPCKVILTTDSEYMRKGMTEWLPGWQKKGWKRSNGAPVLNADLWLALQEAASRHQIEWFWVRGHSGHPENHRADLLANKAIQQILNKV